MKKLRFSAPPHPTSGKIHPSYHDRAQAFISDAKRKGYSVSAEKGELIAHPKGSPGYIEPPIGVMESNIVKRNYKKPSNGIGVGY
jgi:hypothetical protein